MEKTDKMWIFSTLPEVLVNNILNYTNIITFRHGKYMDKIDKNDGRYQLVEKLPKPIKISENSYRILLLNKINSKGYILQFVQRENKHYVHISFNKESNRFLTYNVKSSATYNFDVHNRYMKTVHYNM
jgi:hypothetical protein